jgi:uncharacterized low-complexity protein
MPSVQRIRVRVGIRIVRSRENGAEEDSADDGRTEAAAEAMEAVMVMEAAMEAPTESAAPEASAVKRASVSPTGEGRCGEREEERCDERETHYPAKHVAPPCSEVLRSIALPAAGGLAAPGVFVKYADLTG